MYGGVRGVGEPRLLDLFIIIDSSLFILSLWRYSAYSFTVSASGAFFLTLSIPFTALFNAL